MLRQIKDSLKQFDYFMILIVMILFTIGFFGIYSATYDAGIKEAQSHPYRQLHTMIISIIAFMFISFTGYKCYVKYAPLIYGMGCILLLIVLYKGYVGMGAQRWISVFGISGQPSELFKWIWVIMIAWMFSDLESDTLGIVKLVRKIIWVIPPFLLVFAQPDLGTATTYLAMWCLVVLLLGVRRIIIALALVCTIIAVPIMWEQLEDYQKKRVYSFFAPEQYAGDSGYQAIQSKIAIGSGGLTGKGYLKGTQSHLKFMPERHTDFIFSVISEEFGFMGGAFIIFLFLILIARIMFLAISVRDANAKIICSAAGCLLLFQFYINVSMTLGIAPVVGVPLPFISYGGSALLTFVAIIGLVNAVYMRRNEA